GQPVRRNNSQKEYRSRRGITRKTARLALPQSPEFRSAPERTFMKLSKIIKRASEWASPYCITYGKGFRLKDVNPDDTGDLKSEDKARAKEALGIGVEALATLQDMLYAQDRWALLLIFQAMDGAGKDGAIKHVMSGVNPQGCQVASFKAPSAEDLDHDYLWRCQ